MKDFNIDDAKKGKEVITKKGKPVKILLYDRDSKNFPLVVIIDNKQVNCYSTNGKLYIDKDNDNDLAMKE